MTMAEELAGATESSGLTMAEELAGGSIDNTPVIENVVEQTEDKPDKYNVMDGVVEFWSQDEGKADQIAAGLKAEGSEFMEQPGQYLADSAKNLAGGAMHGTGELLDFAVQAGDWLNPFNAVGNMTGNPTPDIPTAGAQKLRDIGLGMAEDTSGPGFAVGDLLGPPLSTSVKYAPKVAGMATDAVDTGLNVMDKVISPMTKPIVDKATDLITRQSVRGSVGDWFKSNFVQDYRLNENYLKYLDEAETGVRVADKSAQGAMNHLMKNTTPEEQTIIERYINGEISHAEEFSIMESNSNLYDNMLTFRSNIIDNEKNLVDLKMLNEEKASSNVLGGIDNKDPLYLKRVFTNEPSQDALPSALKEQLDGLPIYSKKDSRGLYASSKDTDATHSLFEDDYTEGERLFNAGFRQTDDTTQNGRTIWHRPYTDDEYKAFGSTDDLSTRIGATEESQGIKQVQGEFYEKVLNDKSIKTYDNYENGLVRLDENYGKLNGKYVENEVKTSLDLFSGNGEKAIPEKWRKYVNEWKANTVVKNPKSHVNNIVGNVTLSWYSGIPVKEGVKSAGHAFKAAADPAYIKTMDNHKEAEEIGLFGRTSLDEMINQVTGIESKFKPKPLEFGIPFTKKKLNLSGGKEGKIDKITSNIYLGKDSKFGNKFYEAYKNEDDAFKLANYNYWRDKGLSAEESRKKVELAIFDYAKQMPKGLNYLRDTGLIPFVSFQYKSIPLLAKTLADKPSRIGAVTAGLYGVNAMTGGDDNEVGEGKVKVGDSNINTGQWTPYQEYLKPQDKASGILFGGVPQNIAGMAAGKDLSFGRARQVNSKDTKPLEGAWNYLKKGTDVLPIPAVYKAINRSAQDVLFKDRNPVSSAIDRLIVGNKKDKPKSRNRKSRPTRSTR